MMGTFTEISEMNGLIIATNSLGKKSVYTAVHTGNFQPVGKRYGRQDGRQL